MSKFTKVCVIICCTFTGLALACFIAGGVMGVTWSDVRESIYNGTYSIGTYFFHDEYKEYLESDGETLTNEEMSFEKVSRLKINMPAGDLKIETSKDDKIKVQCSDKDNSAKVKCKDNELSIITKGKFEGGKITVYIPQDMSLEEAGIDLGAGRADISSLDAKILEVNIAAGELIISKLMSENIDLECGVGSIEVTLEDSIDNYTANIDCGLGSVKCGEHEQHGASKDATYGHGAKKLSVDCGLGSVVINEHK